MDYFEAGLEIADKICKRCPKNYSDTRCKVKMENCEIAVALLALEQMEFIRQTQYKLKAGFDADGLKDLLNQNGSE